MTLYQHINNNSCLPADPQGISSLGCFPLYLLSFVISFRLLSLIHRPHKVSHPIGLALPADHFCGIIRDIAALRIEPNEYGRVIYFKLKGSLIKHICFWRGSSSVEAVSVFNESQDFCAFINMQFFFLWKGNFILMEVPVNMLKTSCHEKLFIRKMLLLYCVKHLEWPH